MLGKEVKRFVVGHMPAMFTEGEPCLKATVRFQDGALFHTLPDALIYPGDEFVVGGRRIELKKGEELWIVTFRAEEHLTSLEGPARMQGSAL